MPQHDSALCHCFNSWVNKRRGTTNRLSSETNTTEPLDWSISKGAGRQPELIFATRNVSHFSSHFSSRNWVKYNDATPNGKSI